MFKKAERKRVKAKIGLTGPSGSGKTLGALLMAKGLVGENPKIAVLDTENGSASLYADHPLLRGTTFDVVDIFPPYTVEKYIDALNEAQKQKFDVVIIDSASHAWAGEGGILNEKTKTDARGGNSFTNWAKFTPKQEAFLSSILAANCHVICNLRSKQEYVLSDNGSGKQVPKKVGMAPIQREGFEYEMSVVFDVDMNHLAQVSKDRTGLFADSSFKITEKTGEMIREWLMTGAELKPVPVHLVPDAPTEAAEPKPTKTKAKGFSLETPILHSEYQRLATARTKAGWSIDDVKEVLSSYNVTDPIKMKPSEYRGLCSMIESGLTVKDIVDERNKNMGLPPVLDESEKID